MQVYFQQKVYCSINEEMQIELVTNLGIPNLTKESPESSKWRTRSFLDIFVNMTTFSLE